MNRIASLIGVTGGLLALIFTRCSSSTGAGASSDVLEVQFAIDPANPLFATARDSDGTEFAFYADTDSSDTARVSSVNTRLADGTIVKSTLDDQGRPEKIVVGDTAATIEYQDSSAKVIVMEGDEVSESDVPLDSSAARSIYGGDPLILQAAPPPGVRLCDRVRNYVGFLRRLFDCAADDSPPHCRPAFVRLALASRRICDARQRLTGSLPTSIQMLPPLVPVRVQVASSILPIAGGGVDVQLSANAQGGSPPYAFNWFVGMGPLRPDIADMQATSVHLDAPGDYLIRVVVRDAEGQIGTMTLPVSVSGPGAAPRVAAGPDRTVPPGAPVALICMQLAGDPAASFAWRQVSGTPVTLMNANTDRAMFLSPQVQSTLTFECSASNDAGTGTDEVTITVGPP
ncbi:MAG TPA: hypothetical protein VGM03_02750 [Phycisphaerae bacterium]